MSAGRDFREEIQGDFERIYRLAIGRLEAANDATKPYRAKCPNPKCGRDVVIYGVPDVRALNDSLRFLAEQGLGRPAQQAPKRARVDVSGDFASMTDEELLAIMVEEVGGGEVESGDAEPAA